MNAAGASSPSGVMSRNEAGEVQVTRTCIRCGPSTVASQPATCISVTLPWMGTATREEVVETLSCPCAPGRAVHYSIRRQITALPAVMEPEAVGVFDPRDPLGPPSQVSR
ncbi:hypothetical protein VaNZ11_014443 [Volvox africanus]|uniref:Uncharacterized protein n=1 Tax=Volvox africanus TaxID=51714 RepID=A0ABQ5SJV0_9CHLO|nr:hypothetical protein VaNZ11_014443 [Volvox africanus]